MRECGPIEVLGNCEILLSQRVLSIVFDNFINDRGRVGQARLLYCSGFICKHLDLDGVSGYITMFGMANLTLSEIFNHILVLLDDLLFALLDADFVKQ